MKGFECRPIDRRAWLFDWIAKRHYSQTCPKNTRYAFGFFDQRGEKETLVGVCTFGPFTRLQAQQKYEGYIELTRLFVEDVTPKNAESFFIGWCLRWLKRHTDLVGVVSYADPSAGHVGIVYRASNFKQIGVSGQSYHYVNERKERVHKRAVWGRARRASVSEPDQARAEGLTKIMEEPKRIYAFAFKKDVLEKLADVKSRVYTDEDWIAKHVTPKNAPQDFDPELHSAVVIGRRQFLIDKEDLAFVLKSRWFPTGLYMTFRPDVAATPVPFHRMIMATADDHRFVDHINGNKADNRRCNLRLVHPSVNNHNRIRISSTGYRGVKKCKNVPGYEAHITFNYKYISLGYFRSKIDAAIAYDRKAVELYGSAAVTNMPISNYEIPEVCEADKLEAKPVVKNFRRVPCATPDCGRIAAGNNRFCDRCKLLRARHEQAAAEGRVIKAYAPRVKITTDTCSADNCEKMVFARNLCERHWREAKKADGTYTKKKTIHLPCVTPDCKSLGMHRIGDRQWLCRKHYNERQGIVTKRTGRPRKNTGPCSVEGCLERGANKGLCRKHYLLQWRQERSVKTP